MHIDEINEQEPDQPQEEQKSSKPVLYPPESEAV